MTGSGKRRDGSVAPLVTTAAHLAFPITARRTIMDQQEEALLHALHQAERVEALLHQAWLHAADAAELGFVSRQHLDALQHVLATAHAERQRAARALDYYRRGLAALLRAIDWHHFVVYPEVGDIVCMGCAADLGLDLARADIRTWRAGAAGEASCDSCGEEMVPLERAWQGASRPKLVQLREQWATRPPQEH